MFGLGTSILLIVTIVVSSTTLADESDKPGHPGPKYRSGHWELKWIKQKCCGDIEYWDWHWVWIIDDDVVGPVLVYPPVERRLGKYHGIKVD